MENIFILGLASMGGLGFLLASFLALASKKLKVEEDPRLAMIREALPSANCGACGMPGCFNFAEGVIENEVSINGCPVGGAKTAQEIARIMCVEIEGFQRKVAKIFCQGGLKETEKKAAYYGIVDCKSASTISGGEKICEWGCLGYSNCVKTCKFDAIYMNRNGLPVVDEDNCTGCGKCVEACPRNLIELHPPEVMVHVYCKNHDPGKIARKICKKACIACRLCVKPCPDNIRIEDNLAVIDYSNGFIGDRICTEKCPTDSIIYN